MTIVHTLNLQDAVPQPRPEHIAQRGPRRLVKLAPVMGGVPIIWTSPDVTQVNNEDGTKSACRACIVLVQKSPPETMRVHIPCDLIDKLVDVPVEW